jgi:catechol 2,3-dioxygenase-like lactoylglutathione lyase family enzyme
VVLGHLGVNVPDLARARAYYDEFMPAVGFEPFLSASDEFSYRPANGKVGTYVFFYPSLEGADYSRHRTGLQHLAFIVPTRTAVRGVHALVRSLGSAVVHEPRHFPEYGSSYFATFWSDPFGFMLEAVCHHDRD